MNGYLFSYQEDLMQTKKRNAYLELGRRFIHAVLCYCMYSEDYVEI